MATHLFPTPATKTCAHLSEPKETGKLSRMKLRRTKQTSEGLLVIFEIATICHVLMTD